MFDAFLKVSTIPGETTDSAHVDEIEVLEYDLQVEQPLASGQSGSTAGAQSAQRANFGNFTFVHALDASSPKFFLACSKGEHIPEATLALHRATGNKQKYMEYKMTQVIVAKVEPGGNSKGDHNLPLEKVSFNYSKIELTYTKTNNQTGAPMGDVKTWWDRSNNTGG